MILWLQSAVRPLLRQPPGFTGVCRNHVPGAFLAKPAALGGSLQQSALVRAISVASRLQLQQQPSGRRWMLRATTLREDARSVECRLRLR